MPSSAVGIADGFPGQRMLVLPAARVREALSHPGTAQLVVTDCGYFPHAADHGRVRRAGIPQAVVIVCSEGRGWCRTDFGKFSVHAGQVVVLPPGVPHSYGADPDSPWTVWWFHLSGLVLGEFLDIADMTASAPVRNLSDPFQIVALIAEILRWMEHDSSTHSILKGAGTAWHLMSLLVSDRTTADRTGDALEQVAEFLRSHLREEIGVSELAAMAQLSPSHFAAVFKQRFGSAVVQYRSQLRMARARELLATTRQSIPFVANSVGYPDSYYFARQFKKSEGISPREYRKRTSA